jgi:hypothetical protein
MPRLPTKAVTSMDSQAEIEDIFEDGLFSIFGDVKVSHGGAGQVFSYPLEANRYLPDPISSPC